MLTTGGYINCGKFTVEYYALVKTGELQLMQT